MHRREVSWQARTAAVFVAATVPVEDPKDPVSPLLDLAKTIAMDDDEVELLQAMVKTPSEEPAVDAEPPVGSFENFMRFAHGAPPA